MRHAQSSFRPASQDRLLRSVAAALVTGVPLLFSAPIASAETRGYVISWFATATNNPDFLSNCPQAAKDLNRVKFGAAANGQGQNGDTGDRDHALVDGKPVPPLDYPDAVQKDPNIETVVGKYAYGFDLGGPAASQFIDPETHEKVDNQLWRAVGCGNSFQVTPPAMPYNEGVGWDVMIDSAPGWALRITGTDLSKDGPATVTLDRTIRHLERDALGRVRSNVSYVLDPSPRSHNVLSGEINDGVLTVSSGGLYLESTLPFYTQIDLRNVHMRIRSQGEGTLLGYWGGYTDWHKWVYMYTSRPGNADPVGWYRALERLADADPNPATGKNRLISTTWRMEAVPAFLLAQNGNVLAAVSNEGLGGKVQAPQTGAKAAGSVAASTPNSSAQ
jgi:hypothetical protein